MMGTPRKAVVLTLQTEGIKWIFGLLQAFRLGKSYAYEAKSKGSGVAF
jgi:hypothetical protein